MSADANKELVRRFYREAIVERDSSACERLLSVDFVHNGETRGRAGQRQTVDYFLVAFPDLGHEIELLFGEGDLVAAHQRWAGIHGGEFLGVAATGRRIEFTSTAILRVARRPHRRGLGRDGQRRDPGSAGERRWLRSGRRRTCPTRRAGPRSSPAPTAASGWSPRGSWRGPAREVVLACREPGEGRGGGGRRFAPTSAGRLARRSRRSTSPASPRFAPSPRASAADARRPRPADQQRRRDGAAAARDRRRLRAAVRHQPPRPLRAHRAAARRAARAATDARVVTVSSTAHRFGRDRLRRPAVASAATSAGAPTASRSSPTSSSRCELDRRLRAAGSERQAASPPTPATRRPTCSRPRRRCSTAR